jgi:hypothetical protein
MKTIRGFSLILVAAVLLSVCVGQGENEQAKLKQERTAWVAKCLTDFQSIKVGMTRGEVEKKLRIDGGLQSFSRVRYIHFECEYFKIDIEFDVKRDEKDQGRAMVSPEDKVTKVSRPYIDFPVAD